MTTPMGLIAPDDWRFQYKTWKVIEEGLELHDAKHDAVEGYDLAVPEENGPTAQFPSRPLISKFPWEEKIDGFAKPASCNQANWKHTCLKYTIGKGSATLTLTKASLDAAMLDALQDAVVDLKSQKDVRVVLLKAEGKAFCNGFAGPHVLAESKQSDEQIKASQMQFAKILHFLSSLPQFVMALVQGSAMGGGVGLLCACDMVYSVKGAYFAMNEGKLGVVPSVSLPYIMRRIDLMANTRQLVLAGQSFSATQAKQCGLIQEVYEDETTLQAASKEFLARMSGCAPGAVAATKEIIRNTLGQAPSTFVMNYVATIANVQRGSAEAKSGMEAIQAKKRPVWAEKPIEA